MTTHRERPTLQTVADAAGVSRMTVSLALRNSPRLSEATRRRVQRIAEKLGYRPNPLVSILMKQVAARRKAPFTTTLAYITAFETADGWRQRTLSRRFHEGAVARALQLGYNLEEFWLKAPGMNERRLSQILWSRGIPGVIIAPLPHPRGRLRLQWDIFASATIGFSLMQPPLHRAVNHQMRSMTVVLRNLKRLGYRRIGLAISDRFDARADNKWRAGFLAYRHRIGAEDRMPLLVTADFTETRFRKWIRANRPDAVIAGSIQALNWLHAMKVRVPEDVGFATLEYSDARPECAGTRQNARLVGAAAVDLVVEQLEHGDRGIPQVPKVVMIEGEWTPGTTVTDRRRVRRRR